MAKSSPYAEFVVEQFQSLGEITSRSMFGGFCLYCDGVVFALLDENILYLKVDDVTRPNFEARGLTQFNPFGDGGSMNYYRAPAEVFESADAVRDWAGAAIEVGRRAQAKKKPRLPAKKKSAK